ncbi:MAG: hypothetical protein JWQ63_2264 [Mucilaginibacter sp.]|nr:hypothetical protein [Mucilaginibacter sp.]
MTTFLFAFKASHAQTEKGNQTLGVNLGFNYDKINILSINPYDNSSSTQNLTISGFNAGPNYSYFIADKLDIGTSLSYGTNKQTDNGINTVNPTKQTSNNYGATIYLRKYFMFQNKIGFRVGPSLDYSRANTSVNNPISNATINNGNTLNEYTASISLGMVYFPSKKLGVSATIANLSYNHTNINYLNYGHQNQDSLNFRFINDGLSLSIFYVFGS